MVAIRYGRSGNFLIYRFARDFGDNTFCRNQIGKFFFGCFQRLGDACDLTFSFRSAVSQCGHYIRH